MTLQQMTVVEIMVPLTKQIPLKQIERKHTQKEREHDEKAENTITNTVVVCLSELNSRCHDQIT